MTIYQITGTTVTAHPTRPEIAEGTIILESEADLVAAALPLARLTQIWNDLPGAAPVKRFRDRAVAEQRIWAALTQLEPAAGSAPRPSKQAEIIALLRRPDGATIDEIMAATRWQRHTVRGLISGALKKKLGLTITSEKRADGARTYRIVADR